MDVQELPIQGMEVYKNDIPEYGNTVYTYKQLRDFADWYMKNIQYPAQSHHILEYLDNNNLRKSRFKYAKLTPQRLGIQLGQDPRFRKISFNKGGRTYHWWYFADDYKTIKPTPIYDGVIRWKQDYCDFAEWYMQNIQYPAATKEMMEYIEEWDLIKGSMAMKKQSPRSLGYALTRDKESRFKGFKTYDEVKQKSEYRFYFKLEKPIYGKILKVKKQ